MPNAGTFEVVLKHLSEALQPLSEELSSGFIHDLGIGFPASWHNDPQLNGALNTVKSSAGSLPQATEQLTQAIDNGDALQIIAKGAVLGEHVFSVIQGAVQLGETVNQMAQSDGSLSAAQKAHFQDFFDGFIPRILESMAVRLLEEKLPKFFGVLDFIGFAEKNLLNEDGDDITRPPYFQRRLMLNRLVDLFKSPAGYIEELTDLGKPGFDGRKLFKRIEKITEPLDFPTDIIEISGQPPIFEMFLLHLQANNAFNPPALGFELRVPGNGKVENTYPLIEPWSLKSGFEGSFSAGVQGLIDIPNGNFKLQPPTGDIALTINNELLANKPGQSMLLVGLPGGTRLEVGTVSFGNSITATWNPSEGTATFDPSFSVALDDGKLTLDFSGSDGFLSSVIPLEAAEANFSLGADFSADGVMIHGSGGLELQFPSHISLGPLEITSIFFIAKLFDPDPVAIELSSSLKLNLGPLAASVDRLGANVAFDFPDDGQGNLGPLDFSLGFKPPNGVGLSVDAGVVKGGGYLFFDFDKGEYAGALELTFSEIVSLKAIGLITTKMPDGSDGFSLIIIITAEFGTGIQLGFGFTLLGVGGLLGLNRTMRLDALAEGVRTGATESIMFPTNVVENAPKIISDLRNFFPVEQDKFLIGPMAKLGWGTPTLISISLGIIIEIPGNIAILGIIKIALPTEEAALIVLQVNFIGAIEFDKDRLWFFASMYDSRVLFITLEGEMGLLVGWGSDSNFVSAVGGFHPAFNPPPLPFPNPVRISINILNESWGRIRVMGYFAVTSNTAQFGARAELYFGMSALNVEGHIGFDALFQFSPFYMIIQLSASLSVKVFGIGLFSVKVKMSLEGPSPWHAKGTGSISLLFFDIEVDFDFTWGEEKDTELPPISVMPLLVAEYEKQENWTALIPSNNTLFVSLREIDDLAELVLHPVGSLQVTQRAVPLELTLDKLGTQKPDDANHFTLAPADNELSKINDIKEKFAIAQFVDLKDAEKLSSPSYQAIEGGMELSAAGEQLKTGKSVKRHIRYELITIDTNFKRGVRLFFKFITSVFNIFLRGNAVARSQVSHANLKKVQPFDSKVKVQDPGYSAASMTDNTQFGGKSFSSQAQAMEFVTNQVKANPELEGELHVLPNHEINTAA
ncbi:hypothetical protein RQM65_03660 [Pricia sp. S334]|uniref:DUF6603 domain-containing protein n=1 Tax=Pricia mediterranea TaxID=3076079 RepID=A0ABU3L2A8_9FLAO|nr:DUF6603 domain-containing protein [Pricia sp. S334]MDT7827760.1 hypothetical protein [Pricia sp. S334]